MVKRSLSFLHVPVLLLLASHVEGFQQHSHQRPLAPVASILQRDDSHSYSSRGEYSPKCHRRKKSCRWMLQNPNQQQQQPQENDVSLYASTLDVHSMSKMVGNASPSSPTSDSTTTTIANSPCISQSQLVTMACALAVNSGFLNALGLSGLLFGGRAKGVAAVTSTYTQAAVTLLEGGGGIATHLTILGVPMAYMLGSLVNGLVNPQGVQLLSSSENKGMTSASSPSWSAMAPLLISAGMVLLGNALRSLSPSPSSWVMSLAQYSMVFAMGLQNSWTTTVLQGNVLRTAHFSGITSDFGTLLGQQLRRRGNNNNHEHSWKLPILAKLASSFWFGGVLSMWMVRYFGVTPSMGCWASALVYASLWTRLTVMPRLKERAGFLAWMKNTGNASLTPETLSPQSSRRRRRRPPFRFSDVYVS